MNSFGGHLFLLLEKLDCRHARFTDLPRVGCSVGQSVSGWEFLITAKRIIMMTRRSKQRRETCAANALSFNFASIDRCLWPKTRLLPPDVGSSFCVYGFIFYWHYHLRNFMGFTRRSEFYLIWFDLLQMKEKSKFTAPGLMFEPVVKTIVNDWWISSDLFSHVFHLIDDLW